MQKPMIILNAGLEYFRCSLVQSQSKSKNISQVLGYGRRDLCLRSIQVDILQIGVSHAICLGIRSRFAQFAFMWKARHAEGSLWLAVFRKWPEQTLAFC